MSTKFRPAFFAVVFAATAAAAITGATLRAETAETNDINVAETCAKAAWPMIPAACLEGGNGHDVRTVSVDNAFERSMTVRFETAFN